MPDTPPDVDFHLPERLAAIGILVRGERDIFQDFARMMDVFFEAIRPRILRPLLRMVDPFGVFAGVGQFYRMVGHFIEGGVTGLLRTSYGQLLGNNYPFTNRPFVARHLDEVRNRMLRIPDETFNYIRTAVDEGMNNGEGIPEIAERVDNQLLRSDSERWVNRAVTVARTESIGAYNGGTLDAYNAIQEVTGDQLEKIWLATMDARTRDTHFIADGQRVDWGHPFMVGGFPGQFPGDPTLPAQEVINCRCTFLVVERGEAQVGYYSPFRGVPEARKGDTQPGRQFRPDSEILAEVRRRAERGVIRSGDV